MMLATLALSLLLQKTAASGPKAVPDTNDPFALCSVLMVNGKLIFPPYFTPLSQFNQVQLISMGYGGMRETTTGFENRFFFQGVPVGNYEIVATIPGLDVVHQMITLLTSDCSPSPGVNFDVLLHISPALKASPIAEDSVAIDSLIRKVPGKAADSMQKLLDKAANTDAKQMVGPLNDLVKTAPDYYDASLELGIEDKKAELPDEAQHALSRALELNDGSRLASEALGQYRFEANDFEHAAELLAKATRLGSVSSDVYYMLGTAYYRLGKLDLAEASLIRSLDIDPQIGKSYLQLFNVYLKKQQPEKALKQADTYLESYPDTKDHDYVQSMADKLRKQLKPQR